jgi:hypothetical protein
MTLGKNIQLDTAMIKWFAQKCSQGIPLSGHVIMEKATRINKRLVYSLHSKQGPDDGTNSSYATLFESCP